MKILKKRIFAAYWTTIEVNENEVTVRFSFPMNLGLLRAAEWAEREMQEAADWLAEWEDADEMPARMKERLRYMMPQRKGHRKLLHRSGMMELTLGGGGFEIKGVVRMKGDHIHTDERMMAANKIDEAMESMAAWMRENAYAMQLQ
jgi:hypothetical protein